MSRNSFGRVFRFTTWGESHGPAIGAVVDGCPPGIGLSEDDIQPWLDRRRPGHADYAYDAKYGFRDFRGGGRSSARETACRVAAGAVARLVIPEVSIRAWVAEVGGDGIQSFDAHQIGANPFFCPDAETAARWETAIDAARKSGSSLGAIVECEASGVTGEVHHVDAGYHAIGMKAEDAPDIALA